MNLIYPGRVQEYK